MTENQQLQETVITGKTAKEIIKKHVLISMGVGAVPIPFVDVAAITATQLSMISKLAAHHNVQFSNDLGKSIIVSLVGGAGSKALVMASIGSFIKFIPVVGTAVGAVTFPAIAGATTYAIGQVFDKHFAGGGTMLDLKASDMKTYFAEELDKGKEFAGKVKKTVTKPFTSKSESLTEEGKEETI
ncbi:YcjF family protein [[Flexibacter] sp. ATCC 35208]|uniref:YcjF family protein n=1 Tax=[Flexibacter] sp. ATCC 35208 TaxID=1936242 RepID=UPI0009C45AD8|nr:DUF697 domain-containing protein [[Flexibacter] sp. ATCC 35208]OMP79236.1 hypothetical protein BW716_10270 [[Flexibacter] sp. ATCC 35208]